jgi:acyl-CoA thioester hydrolase
MRASQTLSGVLGAATVEPGVPVPPAHAWRARTLRRGMTPVLVIFIRLLAKDKIGIRMRGIPLPGDGLTRSVAAISSLHLLLSENQHSHSHRRMGNTDSPFPPKGNSRSFERPQSEPSIRSPFMRPDPAGFSLWHEVDVRFKDIDVGGHAHHSLVLVFFEEARARYWKDVVGVEGVEDVDFIMAEARVRFHARILYPLRLRVGVRITALKRKHFVMEYLILDPGGDPLASGETTMVMFDYEAKASKSVPRDVAAAIRGHEGEGLPG